MDTNADLALMEQWMQTAIDAAQIGAADGESPFGAAVIGHNRELIFVSCNRVSANGDPSAHAEVLAIRGACKTIGKTELHDCWLVATAEPCPMCAATAAFAGIKTIVFGANEQFVRQVGFETLKMDLRAYMAASQCDFVVYGNVLDRECKRLLVSYAKI